MRVVTGCMDCVFMFLAAELQMSGVYVSLQQHGLFKLSELLIRGRKIALRDEHVAF